MVSIMANIAKFKISRISRNPENSYFRLTLESHMIMMPLSLTSDSYKTAPEEVGIEEKEKGNILGHAFWPAVGFLSNFREQLVECTNARRNTNAEKKRFDQRGSGHSQKQ